jgi:hypothetical protein
MRRLFSASGGKENTSLNDKSDGQKPEQGEIQHNDMRR